MTTMESRIAAEHITTVVRPASVGDALDLRTIGAGERTGTTLVVVADGAVVGALDVIDLANPEEAAVSGLFVRAEHRHHGLARMLLRGASANIVARGRSWAVAWVPADDVPVHRLLSSCGWRRDLRAAGEGTAVYRRRVLTNAFAR
ncbi:MAG: hypothetical protein NVSMB48_27330 [Marmoricola sp.]